MKNRAFIVLFALAAASCTTKNQNSALVITKVIPPTAGTTTVGTATVGTCSLDPGANEFDYLPINPAENSGQIGAVVQNNMISTTTLNPILRTDSNVFFPHQAIVTYEVVGGGGAALPQNVIPVGASGVTSNGGTAVAGFAMFSGVNLSGVAGGTFVRATFHLEGKLLDGSTVHTTEREYLFKVCTSAGCAATGVWGTCL